MTGKKRKSAQYRTLQIRERTFKRRQLYQENTHIRRQYCNYGVILSALQIFDRSLIRAKRDKTKKRYLWEYHHFNGSMAISASGI